MRVLVLAVDGLRPDFLGPFGSEWVQTPTLDHWAASGVVFDAHYADGPCPDAFERAIRTGRHPLAPTACCSDLFADLRAAGVRVVRLGVSGRDPDEPLALKPVRRAVRKAIEQMGDAPRALLWVEINELLPPWQLSADAIAVLFDHAVDDDDQPEAQSIEPWIGPLPDRIVIDDEATITRMQRTYAAAVANLDTGIDRLLGDCAKRGWGDDTLWLLTSGRGFPMGEHEVVGLGAGRIHEEMIHLPMLIRWPNAEHAGLRVSAFTQSADLGPTLRELFGMEMGNPNDDWSGRSVVALARGGDHAPRSMLYVGQQYADRVTRGMRSREWYLLLDEGVVGSRRLYVKPDDRWEINDVYQRNQELAEEMERHMQTMHTS
jgi:arylsulfatase A-like enzyme